MTEGSAPLTVGIVGLGLIGGSLAKAIKRNTPHRVLGDNRSAGVLERALSSGVIDGTLDNGGLQACDVVICALYPADSIDYIIRNKHCFQKGAVVTDCGGVKEKVCDSLFPVALQCGFHFIGGHPMAGIEFSGFDHAFAELFDRASMILTPDPRTPEQPIALLQSLFLSVGFERITLSTPSEHDRVIAYTSQLAHLLSSAYMQSDTALLHRGFSAGSFRDLTRVARLNVTMWTELFFENKAALLEETEGLISRLCAFRDALENDRAGEMKRLLQNGCDMRERV